MENLEQQCFLFYTIIYSLWPWAVLPFAFLYNEIPSADFVISQSVTPFLKIRTNKQASREVCADNLVNRNAVLLGSEGLTTIKIVFVNNRDTGQVAFKVYWQSRLPYPIFQGSQLLGARHSPLLIYRMATSFKTNFYEAVQGDRSKANT